MLSVQYGADQPEYDLIIAKNDNLLKVSVKSSQEGKWGLAQSFLTKADYHAAIDAWLRRHKPRTIVCFVQFKDVPPGALPRVYVATPKEVAARLKATAKGRGATILYENHRWGPRALGAGRVEQVPDEWRFSQRRIYQLLKEA